MSESHDHESTGGFRCTRRPDDPLTKIRLTRRAAFIGAVCFTVIAAGLALAYAQTGDLPWWSGTVGACIGAVVLMSRGAGLSGQAAQLETTLDARKTVVALRRECAYLRSDVTASNAKVTDLAAEMASLKEMIRDGFDGVNDRVDGVDRRFAKAEQHVHDRLDDVVEAELQNARTINAVHGNELHDLNRGRG